jgi:hypothetical protein
MSLLWVQNILLLETWREPTLKFSFRDLPYLARATKLAIVSASTLSTVELSVMQTEAMEDVVRPLTLLLKSSFTSDLSCLSKRPMAFSECWSMDT